MKRLCNLGQLIWGGAAGVVTQPLKPLPDGVGTDFYRLTHLICNMVLNITTAAGGSVTADQMADFLQNINLRVGNENLTNLSGRRLRDFQTFQSPQLDTYATPAIGASVTVSRFVPLVVPLERPHAPEPFDYQVLASLFNGAQVEAQYAGAAIGVNGTVNSASIQLWGAVDRARAGVLTALPEIGNVNLDLFDQLPMGVYSDLFINAPAGGFTAATNLNRIILTADGEDIHKAVAPDVLLSMACADQLVAADTFGGAYWQADFASVSLLPLIWWAYNPKTNKMTGMVDTKGGTLNFDLGGDLTTINVTFRRYKPLSKGRTYDLAQAAGVREPDKVRFERITEDGRAYGPGIAAAPGASIIPIEIVAGPIASLGDVGPRIKPERITRPRPAGIRGAPEGAVTMPTGPAAVGTEAGGERDWQAGRAW